MIEDCLKGNTISRKSLILEHWKSNPLYKTDNQEATSFIQNLQFGW